MSAIIKGGCIIQRKKIMLATIQYPRQTIFLTIRKQLRNDVICMYFYMHKNFRLSKLHFRLLEESLSVEERRGAHAPYEPLLAL